MFTFCKLFPRKMRFMYRHPSLAVIKHKKCHQFGICSVFKEEKYRSIHHDEVEREQIRLTVTLP